MIRQRLAFKLNLKFKILIYFEHVDALFICGLPFEPALNHEDYKLCKYSDMIWSILCGHCIMNQYQVLIGWSM